jgi:hypothetical protein
MKNLLLVFIIALAAGTIHAKSAPLKSGVSQRKLGTKFDFEDMMVRGKYQYPDEAITAVEDEKRLDDLLGVRKHFKDKLENASLRH